MRKIFLIWLMLVLLSLAVSPLFAAGRAPEEKPRKEVPEEEVTLVEELEEEVPETPEELEEEEEEEEAIPIGIPEERFRDIKLAPPK